MSEQMLGFACIYPSNSKISHFCIPQLKNNYWKQVSTSVSAYFKMILYQFINSRVYCWEKLFCIGIIGSSPGPSSWLCQPILIKFPRRFRRRKIYVESIERSNSEPSYFQYTLINTESNFFGDKFTNFSD